MTANKLLPRAILACTFAAAMLLATGAAYPQQAPSLGDLPGADSLSDNSLPTLTPSTVGSVIDDVLGASPGPNEITGVMPDAGGVTDTIDSILPPGAVTDPNPGVNPTGGSGGGGGSTGGAVRGPATSSGSASGGLVPGASTSNGAGLDPARIANGAARRGAQAALDLRGVGGRAMHLAAPMAAPIGIAVAGVLGLVMLAKSNGRLDGLENERKALGGWTVIRL